MVNWIRLTLGTVILGIIEGVTEFLPISSTGHLLLFQQFMGPRSEMFNITIQSGAILAVVVIYWPRLVDFICKWREPAQSVYLLKLGVSLTLTIIGALIFKQLGFKLPEDLAPVTWAVLIGALVIFVAEWHFRKQAGQDKITWLTCLIVGLAQIAAAIFPGTSRSAATILAAMFCGASRPAATEFSFLVGIPTMFAATLYSIGDHWMSGGTFIDELDQVLIGFVISGVTAFLVVKWLIRYVQAHTFLPFAWYRLGLGLILLGWLSLR